MKSSWKSNTFDFIIYLILAITVIACFIPFLHVASVSLSDNGSVMTNKVLLIPRGITLEAYRTVFSDASNIRSLGITAYVTIALTILGLLVTIAMAYPLSRKDLKGRSFFMMLILFTFYFNAGMIPNYINIHELGLMDNIWALVLPALVSPYNMILMRTYLMSAIPESLEESARLDGCTQIGVLIRIILPLSKPMLATLALFFAVGRWNGFQDAYMYISTRNKWVLQERLFYLVSASQSQESFDAAGDANAFAPEVVQAASVMFATIPILIVYPWLQKYFVKGVMIGAVKG